VDDPSAHLAKGKPIRVRPQGHPSHVQLDELRPHQLTKLGVRGARLRACLAPARFAIDDARRVDQREVRERLRHVAEEALAVHSVGTISVMGRCE
jgi:hypothetical protein